MASAERSIVIDRAPEEVFDFLAEGTNNRRWRESVIDIERTSGEGLGSVYKQTLRGPGGRAVSGDYRVTEFERPSRLAFQVIAGPGRPTGTFALEAAGEGRTRLVFSLELRPSGLMRLASPMIARQVRREVDAVEQLKTVLEQDGAPTS